MAPRSAVVRLHQVRGIHLGGASQWHQGIHQWDPTAVASPLEHCLDFEYKLRKEALKQVVRGQASLKEALEAVVKDTELKESFFVTPLTLPSSEQPSKYQRTAGTLAAIT